MKEFYPVDGSRISKEQAAVAGPALEAIALRFNGQATTAEIVRIASDHGHALHRFFTWDNVKAGEQWRRKEAEKLLHSIRYRVVEKGKTKEDRPLFVSFKVTGDEEAREFASRKFGKDEEAIDTQQRRVYVHIDRVLSDEELVVRAIEDARRELGAWRRRWEERQGFAEVFRDKFQPVLSAMDGLAA